MRKVILESPYAGNIAENTAYAERCLKHSLELGEAPIASHLLHTRVLDDTNPDERRMGIDAGLAWLDAADAMVVYCDLGVSPGMLSAMKTAAKEELHIDLRWID